MAKIIKYVCDICKEDDGAGDDKIQGYIHKNTYLEERPLVTAEIHICGVCWKAIKATGTQTVRETA